MSRLFNGVRRIHFLAPRVARRVGNGREVVFHNIKSKRKNHGSWMSRALVGTTTAVLMVEIYSRLVLDPLANAVEEIAVEVEHEEDDDDEIFIALPLTSQEVNPPPYSAKDPEWAEFVRISKDQALRQSMKNTLATFVLDVANHSPAVVNRYGKPIKVTGGMLDIDFPMYPPPIHRQLGILINDDAIAIAYRERESALARMEERVLWPKPVAMAAWGVVTAALSQSKDVLYKTLFGAYTDGLLGQQDALRADAPPAIASATAKPSDVQKAIQAIREQATRKPGELPTSDTTNMTSSDKPAQKAASTGASNGPSSSTSPSTNSNNKDAEETPKQMSPITAGFWDQVKRAHPRKRAYPPRGSVAVTGMVIVDTPKAWLHVDVVGFWDPKTSEYDIPSMQMGLRNARAKVVSPLR